MSVHEIFDKKLGVSVIMQGPDKRQSPITIRPASFGYFKIKDLLRVLAEIQLYPFKRKHVFQINGSTILIEILDYEDDKLKDSVPEEGFIPVEPKHHR